MFPENYNSPMVRWHYCSARQQALSFLQTVGAKALVITESDKPVESVKLIGINEEAQIRKQIVSQERIRSLRRSIVEKVPITVWKKARNGEVRPISIVIKSEGKRATYMEWRSKLNYPKRFEVDVETIVNCRIESNSSDSELTLVRFTNRKRCLDLQFQQRMEVDAFILVLQSYIPDVRIIV